MTSTGRASASDSTGPTSSTGSRCSFPTGEPDREHMPYPTDQRADVLACGHACVGMRLVAQTAVTRRTRTSLRSGSTLTSTNTAPKPAAMARGATGRMNHPQSDHAERGLPTARQRCLVIATATTDRPTGEHDLVRAEPAKPTSRARSSSVAMPCVSALHCANRIASSASRPLRRHARRHSTTCSRAVPRGSS